MFLILLTITSLIALAVCLLVVRLFNQPLARVLRSIVADDISDAWLKYLKFAIFVVGISSGVRLPEMEKYMTPQRGERDVRVTDLSIDRWVLEIYRTIIETLQGIAWMLLAFFVAALIAYVLVRLFEVLRAKSTEK